MRVAHLLPNMAIGGRERMVATLCAQGADVTPMIIGYDPLSLDVATIGCNAEYVQLDRKSADFAARLHGMLRANNIDTVHAQGHVSAHLLNATRAFDGPKIATLHIGMEGSWRWLPQIRSGLRHMDTLYAVSVPMADFYRKISGRDIGVVPNGIPLPRKAALIAVAPRPDEPFRFAMVSRLHPVKRHVDAIAAMDRVIAQGFGATLTIAGEGDEFHRLKQLAQDRPYIRLAGPVSDVATFLARHNGFVICSSHEGMPLALIEAMAAGLPVIATAVGGIPDMLQDCGQLVPARNVGALANAMMSLTDSRQWRTMSTRSRRKSADFDSAKMAASYHNAYRAMADCRQTLVQIA